MLSFGVRPAGSWGRRGIRQLLPEGLGKLIRQGEGVAHLHRGRGGVQLLLFQLQLSQKYWVNRPETPWLSSSRTGASLVL